MDTKKMFCSAENHTDQKAIKFCPECNLFMCNQCFNYHSKLFKNHHIINLTENIENLFTGFCQEDNHTNKLDHFCKTHNQLCCSSCIEKDSKHGNCEISKIEEIKEEKKNNLEKIIKIMENLSTNIKDSINTIITFYEKNQEIKEELKSKVMKIITNIRNKLNEREDEILSQIENTFMSLSPNEKIIKDYEKIPKKINEIIENKVNIDKKLNDSFLLNSYIYDIINIENDFNKIKEINDLINKYNNNTELKIYFYPEENEINKIYNDIKSFGKIYQKENEKNNFFINESDKEIKELNKKIEEIQKIKDNIIIEKNNIIKSLENQLNNEKNNNLNLRNELNNSKIRFTIRSRCALNKCLDTKSLAYGNSPHLWDYGHHNANQIFELENNNDGTYRIKNSHSGFYLGFDADKIAFRKKNENSQSFYVHHFDDGFYLFQEKSGGIIDLSDFHTENGSNIGKCGRNNSEAQQWKLVIHL